MLNAPPIKAFRLLSKYQYHIRYIGSHVEKKNQARHAEFMHHHDAVIIADSF